MPPSAPAVASAPSTEFEDHDDPACNTKLCSTVEAKGVEDILAGLSPEEIAEMPDANMPLRHFRAEKGDAAKALKKLRATLAWRKEFQVETLRDCFHMKEDNADSDENQANAAEFRSILLEENKTGKIYVRGYDRAGRAVVYMKPSLENTNHETNNMRHLVWNMEKAIAITERNGYQKINFVIDYEGFSLLHAPPLSTSKHTLEIMQSHYPERCHRFYLTHPPFAFRAVWGLVKNFVDPHTKEKMVFVHSSKDIETMVQEFGGDASKLEACVGGTHTTSGEWKTFDSNEYFALPLNEGFDDATWGYPSSSVSDTCSSGDN